MSREEARNTRSKSNKVSTVKFLTSYIHNLPDINNLINKHLSILHSNNNGKTMFPSGSLGAIYKRGRNFKEMFLSPLYPIIKIDEGNSITSCNRCDICKHILYIIDNKAKPMHENALESSGFQF